MVSGEGGCGLHLYAHASAEVTGCAFTGLDWAVRTLGREATRDDQRRPHR
jgi:hypothetical protein